MNIDSLDLNKIIKESYLSETLPDTNTYIENSERNTFLSPDSFKD
jgi:hypothetical protein